MKRYECYYTNDLGYDYSAFVRESEDGQFVEYDDLRASIDRLLAVAEGLEHVSDNGRCFKCELIAGLKEMAK